MQYLLYWWWPQTWWWRHDLWGGGTTHAHHSRTALCKQPPTSVPIVSSKLKKLLLQDASMNEYTVHLEKANVFYSSSPPVGLREVNAAVLIMLIHRTSSQPRHIECIGVIQCTWRSILWRLRGCDLASKQLFIYSACFYD